MNTREKMTPREAAQMLERMPAAHVKLGLVRLMEWQAMKEKGLVHIGWYLRCLEYAFNPRPKQTGEAIENRTRVLKLMANIGKTP